jgi:hypothetical protein
VDRIKSDGCIGSDGLLPRSISNPHFCYGEFYANLNEAETRLVHRMHGESNETSLSVEKIPEFELVQSKFCIVNKWLGQFSKQESAAIIYVESTLDKIRPADEYESDQLYIDKFASKVQSILKSADVESTTQNCEFAQIARKYCDKSGTKKTKKKTAPSFTQQTKGKASFPAEHQNGSSEAKETAKNVKNSKISCSWEEKDQRKKFTPSKIDRQNFNASSGSDTVEVDPSNTRATVHSSISSLNSWGANVQGDSAVAFSSSVSTTFLLDCDKMQITAGDSAVKMGESCSRNCELSNNELDAIQSRGKTVSKNELKSNDEIPSQNDLKPDSSFFEAISEANVLPGGSSKASTPQSKSRRVDSKNEPETQADSSLGSSAAEKSIDGTLEFTPEDTGMIATFSNEELKLSQFGLENFVDRHSQIELKRAVYKARKQAIIDEWKRFQNMNRLAGTRLTEYDPEALLLTNRSQELSEMILANKKEKYCRKNIKGNFQSLIYPSIMIDQSEFHLICTIFGMRSGEASEIVRFIAVAKRLGISIEKAKNGFSFKTNDGNGGRKTSLHMPHDSSRLSNVGLRLILKNGGFHPMLFKRVSISNKSTK